MRKSSQKKQTVSGEEEIEWIVKPLIESHKVKAEIFNDYYEDDDDIEQSQICSSSSPNFEPTQGINFKWVSRNSGAHVGNSGFGPKPELGQSSSCIGPEAEVGQSSLGLGPKENELGRQSSCEVGESSINERESEGRERKCGVEEENVEGGGGGGGGVVRRLEELRFGVEEVDLSEEQIKINDQAQVDELLAMESIYGDNVNVLEKQQGLRSFQIHIHIELPDAYTVSAKFNVDAHANSKSSDSSELYSFEVQYLSPLILSCLLPKSYPSHSPPSFTVSVQWLHESEISKLCSMLDLLWNEQSGMEILYQWVDWLHSSTLSSLSFEEGLLLGTYDIRNASDIRAISGCKTTNVDIASMKSYNDERQRENFLNGFHECCICFSEYAGTEFLRLPCHHFFCAICMKTYADVHVKEGTVNKLQCPTTKCGGMIPPGLLKRLLGEEQFNRWESLTLQKTLDSMSDVAYCPRCKTPCLEDEDEHALCSKCFFSFCTLCRERRHVGIACMTPEMKLKQLEERQSSSYIKDEQRRKELDMINEIMSVKQILRDAKQCPSCKIAISRIDGCNKMVCSQCGQYFCYRCNKAIDGYEHFWDGGYCNLFPEETLDENEQWEERANARQVIGQIRAELFAEKSRPCPNCRQMNAKMGNNNHIFCWACQSHYCYLCRKTVRRSSEHYGPKGCKQHSVDY